MSQIHWLTSQNTGHSSLEHAMLISIELSRARIRDIEDRLAARHPAIRADAVRRSRQEAATEAVRLSPPAAVYEICHPIRRLLARARA
ncbi:MAG TPA: hypothetical protein VFU43_12205 [Streptosporangiaceae bacterium]|nr:hypothetical protein [Streptosporangiaceae bacterium]